MEKTKEPQPKVMAKSKAAAYAVMVGALGLIIGFSFGFYLSNRWNTEALANKSATPHKAGNPGASEGEASQQMDFVRKHLEALKQQAAKDPKDVKSRIELGNMYFEVRKLEQAIDWYKQALAIEPNNVDVRADLAKAYLSSNQTDEAEAELQKSLSTNSNHVESLIILGFLKLSARNDKEGARQLWEKVINMNPDLPPNKLDQIKQWVSLLKEGKNPFPK